MLQATSRSGLQIHHQQHQLHQQTAVTANSLSTIESTDPVSSTSTSDDANVDDSDDDLMIIDDSTSTTTIGRGEEEEEEDDDEGEEEEESSNNATAINSDEDNLTQNSSDATETTTGNNNDYSNDNFPSSQNSPTIIVTTNVDEHVDELTGSNTVNLNSESNRASNNQTNNNQSQTPNPFFHSISTTSLQSSSSSSALTPTPIKSSSNPTSPQLSPSISMCQQQQHLSNSLTKLNKQTLVRTISNGSKFGPIPNWPHLKYGNQQLQHHHHQQQQQQQQNNQLSSPTITTAVTTGNGMMMTNTVNDNSNISHHSNPPPHHHHHQQQQHHHHQNQQQNHHKPSQSIPTTPTSPTMINGFLVGGNNTNQQTNQSNSNQQITSPSIMSNTATSPLIMATTAPAQTNSSINLELPLIFGDNYVLTSQLEASNLYRCLDMYSTEEFCCKVVLTKNYYDFLRPHHIMNDHDGINPVKRIIIGKRHTFILFLPSFGDLHSYVRKKRRLNEEEAKKLFGQIVRTVADCHSQGIIIRDLKLRKFIFSDEERTQLKLETLEGASLFDTDDTLTDKHGCPAYVSPEILMCNSFSGLSADCWGLGVILFTMLVGHYPFHDNSASAVFLKIRRGSYNIPDYISPSAKCLIRSLMQNDPKERLTAEDVLSHPWFLPPNKLETSQSINAKKNICNLHSYYIHHHHPQFYQQPVYLPQPNLINTLTTPTTPSTATVMPNTPTILMPSNNGNMQVAAPSTSQQQIQFQQQTSTSSSSSSSSIHPSSPTIQTLTPSSTQTTSNSNSSNGNSNVFFSSVSSPWTLASPTPARSPPRYLSVHPCCYLKSFFLCPSFSLDQVVPDLNL